MEYPVSFLISLTQRQAYFLSTLGIINITLIFYQGPLILFFIEFAELLIECFL